MTISPQRSTAVDFSWPYHEEKFGIFSHVPELAPNYLAVLGPFHIEVWSCVIPSVFIFAFVYWILVFIMEKETGFNLILCVLQSYKIILMQSKYDCHTSPTQYNLDFQFNIPCRYTKMASALVPKNHPSLLVLVLRHHRCCLLWRAHLQSDSTTPTQTNRSVLT